MTKNNLDYEYIEIEQTTNGMKIKRFDDLSERGVNLENHPETYLAKRKKDVEKAKSYKTVFNEVIRMLKEMSWKDITWKIDDTSTRICYPILPEDVRNKMLEASRVNVGMAGNDFKDGSLAFAKTLNGSDINSSNSIFMKVESDAELQRSHFPNHGIPKSLRGTNLGYKLYRALLEKFKYLRSNTAGTTEKDYVWQSIVSKKPDDSDVHAIVTGNDVLAILKTIPDREKINIAKRFISGYVNPSSITSRNFAIDDELKAILPDDIKIMIDPARREEAERRREEIVQRKNRARFELFAPFGVDAHNWEIGDYIVVKQYLMDASYSNLPVRKVVAKEGSEWIALKLTDLEMYERNGSTPDSRRTSRKNEWVKSQLQEGQVDPTAGRIPVKGTGAAPSARSKPTTAPPTGHEEEQGLTASQRRQIKNFMRAGYDIYIKSENLTPAGKNRIASRHDTFNALLVRTEGTGRNITYKICKAATATFENLSRQQFEELGMTKMSRRTLERKSDVQPGDIIHIRDHRKLQSLVMPVYRVTPMSNRQHGVYVKLGHDRPTYFGVMNAMEKLTPATNESETADMYALKMFESFDKFTPRDEMMAKLKAKFPNIWIRKSEEFEKGNTRGIWTGSEGETFVDANKKIPAFNPYSSIFYDNSKKNSYVDEVHKTLAKFLDDNGWYTESYDPGTFFFYPSGKNKNENLQVLR